MALSEDKKAETRDRLNRDPDFRDEFLTSARNMYKKALAFNSEIEDDINTFEKILGADPGTYEFEKNESDEIDIFERILEAYDNQSLLDEKDSSTIN